MRIHFINVVINNDNKLRKDYQSVSIKVIFMNYTLEALRTIVVCVISNKVGLKGRMDQRDIVKIYL